MLGNKIEMEITQLVEQNPTLLRLGLHLEFNDARHRVAAHLQRNIDRSKYTKNVPKRMTNDIFQRIVGSYREHVIDDPVERKSCHFREREVVIRARKWLGTFL